jgi:diacylglycerol kinase family enzyme
VTFTVAQVPDDRRVSFTVTPDDGSTVGIGQPVVVRFATPVTRRADLDQRFLTFRAERVSVALRDPQPRQADGDLLDPGRLLDARIEPAAVLVRVPSEGSA